MADLLAVPWDMPRKRIHAALQFFVSCVAAQQPWMFPWERRQLLGGEDGKGLRTWEKLYWGVFVTAISVFLFSRLLLPNKKAEEDPVRSVTRTRHPELFLLDLLSIKSSRSPIAPLFRHDGADGGRVTCCDRR